MASKTVTRSIVDFTILYVVCLTSHCWCYTFVTIIVRKKQGKNLIWGPIYFQAVLKCYKCFFIMKVIPTLFSIQNKNFRIQNNQKLIADFSSDECLHLTGLEVIGYLVARHSSINIYCFRLINTHLFARHSSINIYCFRLIKSECQ